MNHEIVIWGARGHAKVLEEFLTRSGYRVAAVIDNDPDCDSPFDEIPLYIGEDGLTRWLATRCNIQTNGIVAIGGDRGLIRLRIQEIMKGKGINPITAIHPTAFVAGSVSLGEGCQLLANSSVCVDTRIGDASIINTGAIVDHECDMGRGVHIGPGAVIAGCVTVGHFSFVGSGASILPRIQIGENSIVGAGAVVTRNVEPNSVVVGNPARFVRLNKN